METVANLQKLILVVEDETAISQLLVEVINELEYCICSVANNGLTALKLMESSHFDLITLDLSMPRMDGNSFLKELSSIGFNIPVLVITATPQKFQPSPQVKAVLTKPFDIEQVLNAVDKYILLAS